MNLITILIRIAVRDGFLRYTVRFLRRLKA